MSLRSVRLSAISLILKKTCELLSNYQVDDKVHETFTFTFLKGVADGTQVQKAVEGVVFFSFEDQPELPPITFPIIDADGNGQVDAEEYVQFSKNLGTALFGQTFIDKYTGADWDVQWSESAGRAITSLDTNQDGHVDEEEAVAGQDLIKGYLEIFNAIGADLESTMGAPTLLQFLGVEEPSNAAPSPTPAREGTV